MATYQLSVVPMAQHDTRPHAITVTGARTHNLAGIDVEVPKHRFTVVTGLSGSGKSSLVFSTIAAEAQRATAAGYPAFVRTRLPRNPPADVDRVDGLTSTVVVDQRRFTGNARSTVATATDVSAPLRMLFSRFGSPSAGYSPAYSPNDPSGMCPTCEGLGTQRIIDEDALIDPERTLRQGPVRFPTFRPGTYQAKRLLTSGLADPDVPWSHLPASTRDVLLHAESRPLDNPGEGYPQHGLFDGIVPRIRKRYLTQNPSHLTEKERAALERIVHSGTCPDCGGARLNGAARRSVIDGRSLADWMTVPVVDLRSIVAAAGESLGQAAASLIDDISTTLTGLADVGLGYLTLGRSSPGLSGGEAQRVKIVRQLGSPLSDVTYVFDEPSAGLHAHDVHRLTGLLRRLRDRGNTVLVVEHHRSVITAADHVISLGPGAGENGGQVVYTGPPEPGKNLPEVKLKTPVRQPRGRFTIAHASSHNLVDVSVDIPDGVLTVVTGVAGSGKSTLVTEDFVRQNPNFTVIGQQPLHGGRRSTPLTVMGVSDEVRAVFAAAGREAGLDARWFSRNSRGACGECKGRGEIIIDLAFLDDTRTPCEACGGTGFNGDALSVRVNGRTIADVAGLRPVELEPLLGPSGQRRIRWMGKVGLDHIAVGRGIDSLSGGERQRLLLARHLADDGSVDPGDLNIVLDEPTSGLHAADVRRLLDLFDDLVANGATLVVIEHSLQVAARADHIVDLGPGAGHDGGRVVYEGTPAELATSGTITGNYLREAIGM